MRRNEEEMRKNKRMREEVKQNKIERKYNIELR